jgi:hypothetical protein
MADPVRLTLTLAAASATAVAASQTPGGAGNLVLTGGANNTAGPTLIQGKIYTNYALMDVARRIQVASAGSADGAIVFTIIGFNRDMQPITETVTGVVAATPVATKRDFLIVTSVGVSAATAAAASVGTNTTGSTAWVYVSPVGAPWSLSAALVGVSGAACNCQIEHTYDDPNAEIDPPMGGFILENAAIPPFTFITGAAQVALAVGAGYEITYANQPIVAHRMTITSGTGVVAFYSLQSGTVS